jgi:hypothetical protein
LNALGAIISTIHIAIKFSRDREIVITIRGKGSEARSCYLEGFNIIKAHLVVKENYEVKGRKKMEWRDMPKDARVMMESFDMRVDFEHQIPQPEGNQLDVQAEKQESHTMKIGGNLPPTL